MDARSGASPGTTTNWKRPEVNTFFRFTEGKWLASYGTRISVFATLLKITGRDGRTSEANFAGVTILTPGEERIESWPPKEIISHPHISFKVTLDIGVDVDGIMKKKNAPKPATPVASPAAPVISPALQVVLQRALITGMCFDTKFLARSSGTNSRPMEPLYAHSTVLDAVQPALLRLCSNSDEDSHRDLECDISFDEYDSDSDFDETEVNCEPDAGEDALIEESTSQNRLSSSTTLREPPPAYYPTQNAIRTIRVHGVALKSLKALIYHCYTAQMFFSPLKSSDADKTGDQPVLPDRFYCSPKSMYRLADKIGAQELKKLSLESIRSSLSKHNILDEVFSQFTSRYPEVLNMELNLLVKNIREPEVVQALPAKMKAVASGAFPHSGEILTKTYMQRVK
ncbi:hypothetical protein BJ138DRAFT_1128209 [Hygrophoropsis aurantiaca]|uniref:Uncharacterized protein n=1 Tax=Hygrophoropsis aurantiaca TaxID=72124 RepID=A0ACB8A6W0_9AGAM|nr:hypothetical protein BJ138DRAFT_1128209 [Hygrophoropsis aurantiaca]